MAAAAALATVVVGLTGCGSSGDDDEATNSTTTTAEATDELAGTWEGEPTTCEEQEAVIEDQFTAEERAAGTFECVPETVTLRFQDGGLTVFEDQDVGWQGAYTVVDDTTFQAGEDVSGTGMYITYHYEIDGDTLVVDMLQDDMPGAATDAELFGERAAQTRIYETSTFTRAED